MAPTSTAKHETTSQWRPLTLRNPKSQATLPPLYYRCQIDSSSPTRLTLHLTDLVNLHSCHLSRKDIIDEATRSHSPIDPASSAKQFDVLLNYLTQSLQGKENILVRATDDLSTGTATQRLKLCTTIALPAPLPSLSFTFALAPESSASFSTTFVHPVLSALRDTKIQNEHLLDVIRDKDHVIERLLERVGTQVQGDMSLVFPALTASKDRGIREAEKRVKGFRAWDKVPWQEKVGLGFGGDDGVEVFGGLLGHDVEKSKVKRDSAVKWVEELPGEDVLHVQEGKGKGQGRGLVRRQSTKISEVGGDEEDDSATESEDEFERQLTPPNARRTAHDARSTASPAASKHTRAQSEQSTDGSEDEPPTKKHKPSPTTRVRQGGKLGGLGRSKRPAVSEQQNPSSSPERDTQSQKQTPPPISTRTQRRPSTSTASETASDDDASPPKRTSEQRAAKPTAKSSSPASASSSPPPKQKAAPPRSSRLGALKRKNPAKTSRDPSTDPEQQNVKDNSASSSLTSPQGTRQLGRLNNTRRQTDRAGSARTPSVEPKTTTASKEASTEASSQANTPHRLGKLGLRRKVAAAGVDHADANDASEKTSPPKAASPARTKASAVKQAAREDADADADAGTETEDEDLDLDNPPTTRSQARSHRNITDKNNDTKDTQEKTKQQRGSAREEEGDEEGPSKKRKAQPADAAPVAAAAVESEKKEEEEEEEETPEQAARRRREELKRTAAAAPVRKKRRF